MIELKNISTVYDDSFVALHEINLEIKDGELVSIVGPPERGRVRSLRLLTRELRPTDGRGGY